jgi:hypothetical protein
MRLKVLIIVIAAVLGLNPLAHADGHDTEVAGNANANISIEFTSGPDLDLNFTFVFFSSTFPWTNRETDLESSKEPPAPKNKVDRAPIPHSLLLIGTGVLGLIFLRRRNY